MIHEIIICIIFFAAMLINAVTGFAGNLLAMPTTIQLIGMTDAKVMSTIGSFIEKDPAICNKGSVDIFLGSFNFKTVNS